MLKSILIRKKKKKKLTILKSPHINKTAQEQFEARIFSKKLIIYPIKNSKYLAFFKKIRNNLFSDIYIKTKFSLNKTAENNLKLKIFNPNNFKINKNFYVNQRIERETKKKKL